ncbi:hypothetical protein D3C72_2533500 [compost metagenome]
MSISSWMRACCIFIEALLTISRELMWAISSWASRPLARNVLPVSTTSMILSASPTSGANSIEPYSLMIST